MKQNSYIGLWMILSLSLLILAVFSFSAVELELGHWTIKKAPISETLLKGKSYNEITSIEAALDTIIMPVQEKQQTDSAAQSIFIFGDSMTYNLALRLAKYAKENGHIIHSVNWDSSNTKLWAESDTLEYFINKYRPTQIFISLGSNEMYFKNPETRIPFVQKIIEIIDTIPFVWIGPPNWKADTGINDMLAKICGPRQFFKSEGMTFKRKADNIHPTRESSAQWMDSIMRWLPNSAHPFIANPPTDSIGKVRANVVFLKVYQNKKKANTRKKADANEIHS